MRAAVVHELGQTPGPHDRADPLRAPAHSLVRVTAAAVNPIDLSISAGGHPLGAPSVPHVPGIEGAGTVIDSDTLAPGTRVRIQVPGCFVDGTLAELVAVPDAACLLIPDSLEDDQAAALGAVGISGLVALQDAAALRTGESVLILGATGGLGQALLQLAKALGAKRVVAAGRSPERLESLMARGIADAALHLDPDPSTFAQRLAEAGGPVDVIVDSLWGLYAAPAIAGLKSHGRFVSMGQSAGEEASLDSGILRHHRLTITGLSGASIPPDRAAAAFAQVVEYATAGRLSLPTQVHGLDDVAEAWKAVAGSPGAKVIIHP